MHKAGPANMQDKAGNGVSYRRGHDTFMHFKGKSRCTMHVFKITKTFVRVWLTVRYSTNSMEQKQKPSPYNRYGSMPRLSENSEAIFDVGAAAAAFLRPSTSGRCDL